MTILRRGGLAAVGLVALGACKLVAAWAIARWQGAAIQGAFSLALACSSFGGIVLGAGFEYANAYVVGRDPGRSGVVMTNTLALTVAALVLAPLWVGGFGLVLPKLYPGGGPDLVVWLGVAAATGLAVATQGLQAIAIGREDIRGVAMANLTLGILWGIGSLVTARISYRGLLLAWVASQALQVAFYLVRLGWKPGRDRVDRGVLAEQGRYGIKTMPGSISRALNMRTGLYVGSVYLSRELLGVYGLLVTLADALLYLPSAFGQVILGAAAKRGGDAPSFRPAYAVVGVVGLVATAVAAVAGGPLLAVVFGPSYRAGGLALAILFLAATIHALGLLRLHHHLGAGRPAVASRAQLVGLGFTLIGALVLIPRFGLIGAAIATLAAYAGFSGYLFLRVPMPSHPDAPGPRASGRG